MSDVSCRVFAYFRAAEKAGWIDIAQLLEGLPLTREYLETPSNRVAWSLWRQLCERSALQLGTPERIRESGAFAINDTIAGFFGPALTLFSSPRDVYRLAFRWLCPSVYRSHRFSYAELPDGRLELGIELREGHEGCPSFFLMFEGGLRCAPRFLKLGDAVVQSTFHSDRQATYLVTPPVQRSLASRLGRMLGVSSAPSDVEREFTFQQQQMLFTHESLRTSERSFRSVLDALPVLVAIQREGRVLYANPAMGRSLGLSPGDVVGESFHALVAPDDADRFRSLVVDQGGEVGRMEEIRLRTASGGELPVAALGMPDVTFEGDAARGLVAVDLSERRVIEARLRHAEETTQALLATMPDLIVRLDETGIVLDSQAGKTLKRTGALQGARGQSVEQLLGLFPGLTAELVARGLPLVREAITTREVRQLETEVHYDDGSRRHFELRIVPLYERREVLVIVRDVTRRVADARQLAISDRMASLGTLAAGVAHEINNPLTCVMGSLSELSRELDRLTQAPGAPSTVSLRSALEGAHEGVARVRAIVGSLRTFSRVDERIVEPVNLQVVLEQAIAMTAHELRNGARLVRDYQATNRAMADPTQVVQVLVNLLANAIHSIPDGRRDGNEIQVRTGDGDGNVWIEVRDTGEGIAPTDLARIFDPFYTTKPHGRGTGLGLAISHRIVGDLGGRLSVNSEVGVGSVFRVELPQAKQIPPSATPAVERRASPSLETASGNILVVEDELVLAEILRRTLDRFATTVVHSGRDAIDVLTSRADFDLVLCDITMPELTGVDVFEHATRLHPQLADRFLFMTGGVTTARAQTFLETELPQVLWKPFAPNELAERVEQMLAGTVTS